MDSTTTAEASDAGNELVELGLLLIVTGLFVAVAT
jgi:hypothetical protein